MKKWMLAVAGAVIGAIAVLLVVLGNPGNMGFCIACFERDIAGALHLHSAETVQYMRPEIIGLVLGAFLIALVKREFKPQGGSSPVTRLVLGFFVMVGALMFLGCPLRMVLRIGGGDLNAIVGLIGFIAGIGAGVLFLNKGFTLKRTYKQSAPEGAWISAANVIFLVLLVVFPGVLAFSTSGPGASRAPLWISLIAGLVVGAIAQRTRLCMVGGIRDVMLFKDWTLLCGFIAIIVVSLVGNLLTSHFVLGFAGQPIAHTDGIWNFLGMTLVGFGSVLLGGCPLRQLILSGEGNGDSSIAVVGMVLGAAFCHNFKLASSTDGPTANGKIAVIVGLVVVTAIAVMYTMKARKTKASAEPAVTTAAK